jgi:hypothetical protein
MKLRLSRPAALLAATVLVSAALSSPAQAIPSSCSFGFYNTTTQSFASCTAGTGEFRAKIKCDIPWGVDTVHRGVWLGVTRPPSNSIATCPLDARKGYDVGIERR